jgi:hypothetical protein
MAGQWGQEKIRGHDTYFPEQDSGLAQSTLPLPPLNGALPPPLRIALRKRPHEKQRP